MSDSSLAQLYYYKETNWAEVPSTPTLTELRYVSETLGQSTSTTVSAEVRSDGQNADVVRTNVEAAGDVSIEMSHGSYDALLEGALRDAYSTLTDPTDDLTAATATTITRAAGSFITDGFQVGQWIYTVWATDSVNDGWHKVTAVAATTLTVGNSSLTTGSAQSVTVTGDFLKNGTTKSSFLLEKKLPTSGGDEFVSFRGMRVGGAELSIAPGSILTGSFSFQGERAYAAGATVGDGSPTAAATTDVLNAIDNVAEIREGGALTTMDITNMTLSIDGALRAQPAVAVLGNSGIGIGTIAVTGTIEAYFESRTEYEKYLDFTTSEVSFELSDAASNRYMIDMPQLKYTDGQVQVPGKDGDVLVSLQFTAYRDPSDGFTIGITRA